MLIAQWVKNISLWTWLFVASCDAPLFSYGEKLTVNPYSWLCGSSPYHPLAASFPAKRELVQFVVLWIKHILCFLLSLCFSPNIFQYNYCFFRAVGNRTSHRIQHLDVPGISTGAQRDSLVYSLIFTANVPLVFTTTTIYQADFCTDQSAKITRQLWQWANQSPSPECEELTDSPCSPEVFGIIRSCNDSQMNLVFITSN